VTTSAPDDRSWRRSARAVAGALCLTQALVLAGFGVFYLVELVAGAGSDQTRVVMSAVLILVFAVGLGWLARLWWSGSTWATTPTILWNVLLVPVALGFVQSGQPLLGILLFVVLVATVAAATGGRVSSDGLATDRGSGEDS